MPTSRPLTTRPEAARRACDLCGAPVGSAAVEAVFEAETRRFCCTGCRQVYAILLQAAGSADPEMFRHSELFRRCRDSGIIRGPDTAPRPTAATPPQADAPGLDLTLTIENLRCQACAWLIETVLGRIPGVHAAVCGFATDRLQLRYDPVRVDPARLMETLRRYGYRSSLPGDASGGDDRRREWVRFGVCAFLCMNVMMLSWALYVGFFSHLGEEAVASISWPMAVMATVVVGYGGAPFLAQAWRGVAQAAFGMDLLVTVGAQGHTGVIGRALDSEDPGTLGVQDALGDERVNRRTPLEGGIELQQRLGPEKAVPQIAVDPGSDQLVADREEALDVGPVIANELVAKSEDIHGDQYLRNALGEGGKAGVGARVQR